MNIYNILHIGLKEMKAKFGVEYNMVKFLEYK